MHLPLAQTFYRFTSASRSLLCLLCLILCPSVDVLITEALARDGQAGRPRFAVVGGGFAGVAAAWHLLALSNPRAIDIDLLDVAGIAGGASGAAAGLLHPFSPKGKVGHLQ